VNKLTGLRVDASRVLELTVRATSDFLDGKSQDITRRCKRYEPEPAPGGKIVVREGAEDQSGVGEVAKPVRPVGQPGGMVWHPF
jgi:hypothetical protein